MGKKEELKIRQQKNFLEEVINAQQEMICRFLPDTTLIFVNQAYCRYMGLPEEKLIGTKWIDFIPKGEQKTIFNHLRKIGKTGEIINYQHEVIMPDGRKTWQQWTDLPILDDDGELQEFQAVGLDITAQKKAELDLEVERVRLESILRTIDTVVWTAKLNPFRPEFVSEPIKKLRASPQRSFIKIPTCSTKCSWKMSAKKHARSFIS
jgi:PAS domain S-box-containing protein